MEFNHVSVLQSEVVKQLVVNKNGIYVDCTLGGAGHAYAIGQLLSANSTMVGFDQDEDALAVASSRLAMLPCRVITIGSNFRFLRKELESLGITEVDGILFDLGVSSYQLDTAQRGFSYMQNGPLDMRMDQGNPKTAEILVNEESAEELVRIIKEYGEERWAKRIVDFIVEARKEKRIKTTWELVEIIKKAIPQKARQEGPHPAKRTFQALRIAVNEELAILEQSFKDAVSLLKKGGRIGVITFHSLEDRITKQVFKELGRQCICPVELPLCVCGNNHAVLKTLGKAIVPSIEEVEGNPRARSAKLRVGERV